MIVRAILSRLRCITSRSTQSAGVSRSNFDRPTSDASAAGDVRVTRSLRWERLGPLGWADYTPGAENGNAQETSRPLGHWSESDQTLRDPYPDHLAAIAFRVEVQGVGSLAISAFPTSAFRVPSDLATIPRSPVDAICCALRSHEFLRSASRKSVILDRGLSRIDARTRRD